MKPFQPFYLFFVLQILLQHSMVAQISLGCEPDSVFASNLSYGTMSDQDGNVYKTITIGSQEWMAENLRTAHYANGDPIPLVTGNGWLNLSNGATCWYNNDSSNHNCPYGRLYNAFAVQDSRKLCPTGWVVPSDNDWTLLENSLGGPDAAGGKMKSQGFQYFLSPNQDATNQSGFSGLPGGFRYGIAGAGPFEGKQTNGYWWSSTSGTSQPGTSIFRSLGFDIGFLAASNFLNRSGMSVRCMRIGALETGRTKNNLPFTVLPNPAKGSFRIEAVSGMQNLRFCLLNSHGLCVLEGMLSDRKCEIPASHLPAGLYLLQLAGDHPKAIRLILE